MRLERNNFWCRSKIILIKAILKHSIKIVKNEMNMFKLAVANNYHDITNGELGLSPGFVTSHSVTRHLFGEQFFVFACMEERRSDDMLESLCSLYNHSF